jgi:hypothetical protein
MRKLKSQRDWKLKMAYRTEIFNDPQLKEEFIDWLVENQWPNLSKSYQRLWSYYSNPSFEQTTNAYSRSRRQYIQAQEAGLPSRITGLVYTDGTVTGGVRQIDQIARKEVVIENDIGWRVNAIVDFLFGRPVDFISKAPDSQKSAEISAIIKALFSANGAVGFLQDMAVLGSVYGFVDCLVRPGEQLTQMLTSCSLHTSAGRTGPGSLEKAIHLASTIDLELIEAPRAIPVLDENDYKKINYYIQHFHQKKNSVTGKDTFLSRLLGSSGANRRTSTNITEIISSSAWQRYEDKNLAAQGDNPLGFIPVVHIQNIAQPYYYEGLSDVEPLVALQNELNTRLSDRASRITFQSFKMYLGRGIEGFEDKPVSPGRMWYTDNPDASIEEFGGDSSSPSEDLHIAQIREAMDKTSGVTPIVAGLLQDRVGNLTSAVALQITMMGMLSRNQRKQFTYGQGLKKICSMVLRMLDAAGVYQTDETERDVEVVFPNPLPENTTEKLSNAKMKIELGVPAEKVLHELGYEKCEK